MICKIKIVMYGLTVGLSFETLLQVVRGKKTKAAKAKAKYADQDEEDRELAMQFLASAGAHSLSLLLSLFFSSFQPSFLVQSCDAALAKKAC